MALSSVIVYRHCELSDSSVARKDITKSCGFPNARGVIDRCSMSNLCVRSVLAAYGECMKCTLRIEMQKLVPDVDIIALYFSYLHGKEK